MNPLNKLIELAVQNPCSIALPEGEDARITEGAVRAHADGFARLTLLGNRELVESGIRNAGGVPGDFDIIDPLSAELAEDYAMAFHELRAHKGVDIEAAREAMKNPLAYAAMMVRRGDADGSIGGAVATTADTLRAALQIIGRAPDTKLVSSFFLMFLNPDVHPENSVVVFSDGALVVDPTAMEMAEIAHASAASFQTMVGTEPKVAMLSFSTSGSAKHPRVEKVQEATALLRSRNPAMLVDGDIQFDAAFVPEISRMKVTGSQTNGRANVMIFPSLEAANIGYKIAQRIGGAIALGPVLQGMAKPANDLSRGCSADDVYNMIAVTVLQASVAQ